MTLDEKIIDLPEKLQEYLSQKATGSCLVKSSMRGGITQVLIKQQQIKILK